MAHKYNFSLPGLKQESDTNFANLKLARNRFHWKGIASSDGLSGPKHERVQSENNNEKQQMK